MKPSIQAKHQSKQTKRTDDFLFDVPFITQAQREALVSNFVGYNGLRSRFGINYSRVHIRRKIKVGDFPEPIALGTHKVFRVADIEKWLRNQPLVKLAEKGA